MDQAVLFAVIASSTLPLGRYEVQADEGVADEAKRVIAAMPGRS